MIDRTARLTRARGELASRKPVVLLLASTMLFFSPRAAAEQLVAFPAPPSESNAIPAQAALRVFVASSIADAALLTQWLEERNSDLSDALLLPEHEQWIEVRIDGTTYDYVVNVVAMRDGEPLTSPPAPITCECSSGSLLAMLDREISSAVYRLRSTPLGAPAQAPTPTGPTPERASGSQQADATAPHPRLWSISPLGVAGAATGAFGLIALGTGSTFVVIEPRQVDGWSKLDRDLAPLGYATLSVGTAALAGGVAMIVVDAVRLRKRSKRAALAGEAARTRSFAVAPACGRGAVGAVFFRRF